MFCWSNSHDLQIRSLLNCSLLRKSAKHKWNWTRYQQVKQILNWYKTGMHHDCRLNWLNNFSLLYQSYIMHQHVLMGLGHTESRGTTHLLTLIFSWLQQMGAYSPVWRYRWNIIIDPSCFTIPSNTTFFTEFLWHSCLWDHISFVFTTLWDRISWTMLERFLNLHKMMVAVEQKTKQNGNIFLIILMKSLSTKTIQLTRMHMSFSWPDCKKVSAQSQRSSSRFSGVLQEY
jgi:hypothetical protein